MGIAGIDALYQNKDKVKFMPAAKPHHDGTDVKVSLAERAQFRDGSGYGIDEEPLESDFVAFAEEGVETEEEVKQ